jgi:hypothetical protein
MFKLTVTFIVLLHGGTNATAPVANVEGTRTFQDEATCKVAGEIIYGTLAAGIDAKARAAGIGVLQGANIQCKASGEHI